MKSTIKTSTATLLVEPSPFFSSLIRMMVQCDAGEPSAKVVSVNLNRAQAEELGFAIESALELAAPLPELSDLGEAKNAGRDL